MTDYAGNSLADCATVTQCLSALERMFHASGITDGARDARLLVCAAFGLSHLDLALRPDAPLDAARLHRLDAMAQRRLRREPVTRILGARGFWSLDLDVHPNVLDPRPDTEIVIEASLKALGSRTREPLRILDIGTGSGALIAALLTELPQATGCAIDVSPHAVSAARANLAKLGLDGRAEVRLQSWADPLPQRFDLIVSNPPYIETAAIASLDREVRDHDPRLALDGGADGLDAYRELARRRQDWAAPGGLVVVEIGATQAASVKAMFEATGARMVCLHKDYAGLDRVLVFTHALV
ncbi:MAG: peptide chain release factor N(5)-glutamine methyltransferase [Beijerinckiaceae bacterium]|nr:peptide chain release factor N(5)-glutamine methyltransferase [Beijerinckiaceae bacterium]